MKVQSSFNYAAVSCFSERPSDNIRYLINRQLTKLVDISIAEALEFVNTSDTKAKALKQLKYTVLIAEANISNDLQKIIKALVRIWQTDIQQVEKTIKDIMTIIGYHVKSNFYLPLMMNILTGDDFKNSPKNIIILLKLISFMLLTSEDLQYHLKDIIKLISTYEALFIDNDEGLSTVCEIAITLINRLSNLQFERLVSTVFSVLLNVESTNSIPEELRLRVQSAMEVLAKKAGYKSVPELHAHEVGPVLAKIIEKKEYTTWTKTSKNRFKFDRIVRNCQGQAIKYLTQILTVLQYCISLDCEIQIRMDTLVLLQQMLSNPEIRQNLKPHSCRIFLKILNTSIKWKVGKPQIKIRKAGIINMISMIQLQIINQNQLIQCFPQFLPQIKTCISDDWAPQLRFSCCQFLEKFFITTKDSIDGDLLKDLYVILLERLDDSQDPIRKKITIALNLFFMSKYLPLATSLSSTLQYMINSIFIHFDDNNQQIRDAINVTLRHAARVDPNQVLKTAKINSKKMKHKTQCQELIEFCQEIIEDRKL